MIFQKIQKISKISKIFNRKSYWKSNSGFSKISKILDFPKKSRFFRKIFSFFQISRRIFYGFQNFLMFWKEEKLLIKLNCTYIYEIFLQTQKSRHF